MKFIKLGYSVITYLFFLAVFNYLVLFLGAGFLAEWIPVLSTAKTVDSGSVYFALPAIPAWLGNIVLLLVFSFQHSIMARAGVKRVVTRFIPESAERSTYVLFTCALLAWMFLAWQPQSSVIWATEGWLAVSLTLIFLLGAGLVLWSTFMISHWRLFGLSQAWHAFAGKELAPDSFETPSLYKYSRHPMYVGILLVMWSTPQMTVGHLVLALVWTAYVFIGIYFEERDLIRHFGQQYLDYRNSVSKLFPFKSLLGSAPMPGRDKAKAN
ncbi:isoprenylcysteine carboxylmethyltransferase family protein [Seongchinamella unica]|uniref:Isoprenylcysteine carboxylmethyltransferase family protein n=1 Tax=Seongchinamella unica TaxID=2547392 RepID=A0A4R5LRT6_9GAMM|nr:isoprenylcysteine carboxylmethyltransferase family protein [Seongchinamella unica]TDG13437.1 isoprenylcysteine carboxylmethyltransferase family protein [Seongchinamella unica]